MSSWHARPSGTPTLFSSWCMQTDRVGQHGKYNSIAMLSNRSTDPATLHFNLILPSASEKILVEKCRTWHRYPPVTRWQSLTRTTPSLHIHDTNFWCWEGYKCKWDIFKAVSSTRNKNKQTNKPTKKLQCHERRLQTPGIPNSRNHWHPGYDSSLSWALLK